MVFHLVWRRQSKHRLWLGFDSRWLVRFGQGYASRARKPRGTRDIELAWITPTLTVSTAFTVLNAPVVA